MKNKDFVFNQIIPLSLTVAVFVCLSAIIFASISGLNLLPLGQPIVLRLHLADILAGMLVYLKTSVDFALFMGLLMAANKGWKNRIAIEIGTAIGNGLGTLLILALWVIFKELHFLLAIMIFLAALILFELAEEGLDNFSNWQAEGGAKKNLYLILQKFLDIVLKVAHPITSRILPDFKKNLNGNQNLPWKKLLLFSISIPFLLGLDDFAGYVPMFNVVNIFGFAVGVMAGHMLLNIALFLSPEKTILWVKNQWVAFLGSVAFIGLAIWGIIEAIKLLV